MEQGAPDFDGAIRPCEQEPGVLWLALAFISVSNVAIGKLSHCVADRTFKMPMRHPQVVLASAGNTFVE